MPTDIRRVGVVLQTTGTENQSVGMELADASCHAVLALRRAGYEVEVVCNYIDEFLEFGRSLAPVRYSYDARDYAEILSGYDLVVSTRLHGAILANSTVRPALLIADGDSRLEGASALFPHIHAVGPGGIAEAVGGFDIAKEALGLAEWKKGIALRYRDLLGQHLAEYADIR